MQSSFTSKFLEVFIDTFEMKCTLQSILGYVRIRVETCGQKVCVAHLNDVTMFSMLVKIVLKVTKPLHMVSHNIYPHMVMRFFAMTF